MFSKSLSFSRETNQVNFQLKKKLISSEEKLSGFEFDGGKTATFFEMQEPEYNLNGKSGIFTLRIDVKTEIT